MVISHQCYNKYSMSDIKTKIRQKKYWLKRDVLVFDNVVLFIAIALCLAWTWGSISAMTRNWSLAQEIASRKRELALLELEVETLELENEYYSSTEYQELAARKYQNKMLPGETMVYLPKNSTAAINKHSTVDASASSDSSLETSNVKQWLNFLFGK